MDSTGTFKTGGDRMGLIFGRTIFVAGEDEVSTFFPVKGQIINILGSVGHMS